MNRRLFALGAIVLGTGLVVACTQNVPVGADGTSAGDLNEVDAGTGLCGAAACAPGQLCCKQSECSSAVACESVTSCPALPLGACPADSGQADTAPPPDAGECCPVGYDLYGCTFPDGGAGHACHNPAMGCASSTTCGEGCDPVVTGTCGSPPPDAGTGLQWYTTCGYPVCQGAPTDGGSDDAGLETCAMPGTPCTTKGETCGTPNAANCGSTLVCDDHDPKGGPGGCPISSSKYKDDIQYVSEGQLEQLHDETMRLKLATYNYKGEVADPNPLHLGFIIEDDPTSLAVDRNHNRVDMYGYISMVVASMQVQQKEIALLRKELAEARRQAAARK